MAAGHPLLGTSSPGDGAGGGTRGYWRSTGTEQWGLLSAMTSAPAIRVPVRSASGWTTPASSWFTSGVTTVETAADRMLSTVAVGSVTGRPSRVAVTVRPLRVTEPLARESEPEPAEYAVSNCCGGTVMVVDRACPAADAAETFTSTPMVKLTRPSSDGTPILPDTANGTVRSAVIRPLVVATVMLCAETGAALAELAHVTWVRWPAAEARDNVRSKGLPVGDPALMPTPMVGRATSSSRPPTVADTCEVVASRIGVGLAREHASCGASMMFRLDVEDSRPGTDVDRLGTVTA